MLTPVPVSRVPHEWDRIAMVLRPAVERDPKRDMEDLLYAAMHGFLRLWRPKEGDGYIATEAQGKALQVVYVGGVSQGLRSMKRLLAALETAALSQKCREVKFEGRDWRRVAPGYVAAKGDDGRWKFRRRIA